MSRFARSAWLLLPLAVALAPAPTRANGQTSHVWITLAAIDAVPDGALRTLLERDDLRPMLKNGAMFPDGGYAVDDDYGEMAHWEPFQSAYLDWIRENYAPPWSDEAAQHIVFLLGMASHGMADQVYDSQFMERAKQEDAASDWAKYSMDEATDVTFAAEVGGIEPPEDWAPYQTFADLYASDFGYSVSTDTMAEGQRLLRFVLDYVGTVSQSETAVAHYTEQFPWATTHQTDPETRGRPADEAEVVARYWAVIWARLNGEEYLQTPMISSFPLDGGLGQARDGSRVEGRVSAVFARGLDAAALDSSLFSVTDAAGEAMPLDEVHVFYGQSAHIVNLSPERDWAEDMDYTVTVAAGVPFIDGRRTEAPVSFTFSTRPPPPEDTGDDTGAADDDAVSAEGCGCGLGGGSPALSALGLAALSLALVRRSAR